MESKCSRGIKTYQFGLLILKNIQGLKYTSLFVLFFFYFKIIQSSPGSQRGAKSLSILNYLCFHLLQQLLAIAVVFCTWTLFSKIFTKTRKHVSSICHHTEKWQRKCKKKLTPVLTRLTFDLEVGFNEHITVNKIQPVQGVC